MSFTLIDSSVIVVCLVAAFFLSRRKGSNLPLPPGPRGFPLIGNFFDAPTSYEWLTYEKWGRQFDSDIIYYEVFGSPVVVVNSYDVAEDLFVKRAAIYSDRPTRPMLTDWTGFSWNFGFMRYGGAWKERRKMFHRELSSSIGFPRHDKEIHAARVFLRRLLDNPGDRTNHLRHMAATTIMSIGYGIEVKPTNDPFVDIAQKAMHIMALTGIPGSFLVDYLPSLKYLPVWLGANFKKKAKEWRPDVKALSDVPFDFVKSSYVNGTASMDSIGKRVLEKLADSNPTDAERARKEDVIKDVLASIYAAGADTTVTGLETFFLAMSLYPDIQKKAQAHVDTIIDATKEGRLPDFSDRVENGTDSPPYLEALLREILRWQAITPLAVAHRVLEEDVYKGYRIPKDATVIGNAWAVLRDERLYPEPHRFNPDRWLIDGQLDRRLPEPTAAFGFGRRICPGKDLAMTTIWITMVSVLASLNIEGGKDGNGLVMDGPPDSLYSPGMLRHPKPFKCSVTPRSKEVESLVRTQSYA